MKSVPFQFKFRWLNASGQPDSLFSKKGHFDGETLQLDDVPLPTAAIAVIEVYDSNLAVSIMTGEEEVESLAFRIYGMDAKELKRAVDVVRSGRWAELTKERMEKEGRAGSFRTEICPRCGATLDLSDMEQTPQLFCHFCDSLSTLEGNEALPREHEFRVCEECGMFAKPRKFTVFYFYFLLVVYGWRQHTTWRCPGCMRGDAWKMLFGNLPFLLGVPVAITQLIRCYGGGITGGPASGLDSANLKARKGDVLGALGGYRQILDKVTYAAGIKYNVGLALLQQNETERAAESLRMCFDDCINYAPAYGVLASCYETLGEEVQLKELRRIWGDDEESVPTLDADDGIPGLDEDDDLEILEDSGTTFGSTLDEDDSDWV